MIVGGAAIFGGRGRIIGSCLGAILVGLIDKVLREGVPITRTIDLGDGETAQVAAVTQLPPGAVPAFLGVILIIAVLIEPWLVRRRAIPAPLGVAARPAAAADSRSRRRRDLRRSRRAATTVQARGLGKRGIAAFFYRRDAAAVMLMVALWLFGWWARPDFWDGLDNSFAILLAFSEIALLAVGLTFVMANGDIDLSVGSVLALSGAVAAVIMKDTSWGPLAAVGGGIGGRRPRRRSSTAGSPPMSACPPSSRRSGTFYWARGIGSSIVAGTQLNGFPESFNLIGRSLYELLDVWAWRPTDGLWLAIAKAVSVQTIFVILVAVDRRHRARPYDLRREGLRDRRQRARGEFRRHQHAPRALHRRS